MDEEFAGVLCWLAIGLVLLGQPWFVLGNFAGAAVLAALAVYEYRRHTGRGRGR